MSSSYRVLFDVFQNFTPPFWYLYLFICFILAFLYLSRTLDNTIYDPREFMTKTRSSRVVVIVCVAPVGLRHQTNTLVVHAENRILTSVKENFLTQYMEYIYSIWVIILPMKYCEQTVFTSETVLSWVSWGIMLCRNMHRRKR